MLTQSSPFSHTSTTPARSRIFPIVTEKTFASDEPCPRCQTALTHIQYGFNGEVQSNGKQILPSNASVDVRVPRRIGGAYDEAAINIVSTATWHGVAH